MMQIIVIVTILVMNVSCGSSESDNIQKWKSEILQAESNFVALAKNEGVPAAFVEFADADAVLLRNNNLILGREALQDYYESHLVDSGNSTLTWKPDFVDVSKSGDLAYTYGYYVFTFLDSTNAEVKTKGVYHTVWKRQNDGSWKFVWD